MAATTSSRASEKQVSDKEMQARAKMAAFMGRVIDTIRSPPAK